MDVGGGNGSLLTEVLRRWPGLQGVLYDLPHVVERAKGGLQAAGVADPDERVNAVRTLIAEETRVSMLIGVAVGFELAHLLANPGED